MSEILYVCVPDYLKCYLGGYICLWKQLYSWIVLLLRLILTTAPHRLRPFPHNMAHSGEEQAPKLLGITV